MRRPGAPGPDEPTPLITSRSADPPAGDLLLVAGEGHVSTYALGDRELVIGRGEGCDVRIDHRALSRRHAVLHRGPPVTVRDLGSTNGTRIAGELRRGGDAVAMAGSDSFHIGPFSFVLVTNAPRDERSMSGRDVLRVVDPTPRGVPALVKDVAASRASVLVLGETGVGKEVLATTLHQLSGRTGALTRINCAALSESLLESELFGHEKGAFTGADKQRIGRFEQADGGTLFLDEIGDMSPNTQAKILRVLQEHEFERLGGTRTIRVDVRLIAATNRALAGMVAAGQFREDLYYRLNVVSIDMPPLRERKEDVPALAEYFIRRFAGELKKRVDGLAPDAVKLLARYNWPGNVRELENAVERAVLLTDERLISVADLHLGDTPATGDAGERGSVVKLPPRGIALEEIERQAVVEALKMSNWVQKDAAELLAISPRVINYKIKVLGIPLPRARRVLELDEPLPDAASSEVA